MCHFPLRCANVEHAQFIIGSSNQYVCVFVLLNTLYVAKILEYGILTTEKKYMVAVTNMVT